MKSLTSGAINDSKECRFVRVFPKRFEVQQRQRHATLAEDEPRNVLGITGEFFPGFEIYIPPLSIWQGVTIWTEVCTPNRMTDNAVVTGRLRGKADRYWLASPLPGSIANRPVRSQKYTFETAAQRRDPCNVPPKSRGQTYPAIRLLLIPEDSP